MTIKHKDPQSYILTSSDLPDMPPGQIVCTTVFYSSLPSIWYATWICLYKMDLWPFGATTPGPLHYLRLDMQHDYVCTKWILDPLVSRFTLKWCRNNGVTLQTNVRPAGRTDGRTAGRPDGWTNGGYHNIPAFSSKSVGITKQVLSSQTVTEQTIIPTWGV